MFTRKTKGKCFTKENPKKMFYLGKPKENFIFRKTKGSFFTLENLTQNANNFIFVWVRSDYPVGKESKICNVSEFAYFSVNFFIIWMFNK